MLPGVKLLFFLLCTATILHLGRAQGVFQVLNEQQESLRCRLGRGIATLLHSETLMSCVSCADNTDCLHRYSLSVIWGDTRDILLEKVAYVCALVSDVVTELRGLRWGQAVLEFLMGLALCCALLFSIAAWTARPEDKFYDVFSFRQLNSSRRKEPKNFKSLSDLKEKVMCDGDCRPETDGTAANTTEGARSVKRTHDPCPNCGATFEGSRKSKTLANAGPEKEQNKENGESNNGNIATEIQDTPTVLVEVKASSDDRRLSSMLSIKKSDDSGSVSQSLQPPRPSPPTVKVFSLHKPNEIPGDIMDALLCLKKDCSHDHSKIRLIGPKVIVYSTLKPRQGNGKDASRVVGHRSSWSAGQTQPSIRERILSNKFELDDKPSHVSTQTETVDPPTTLVIKTEAFMSAEGRKGYPQTFPKGSMTGTLLIAKDSFEAKIVRRSWSQTQSADGSLAASLSQATCLNVRENIAKSRLGLTDLDAQFSGLNFDLGNPQANSTTREEETSDSADIAGESSLFRTTTSLTTTATASKLDNLSDTGVVVTRSAASGLTSQQSTVRHDRDGLPCRSDVPIRRSLVELSHRMPYMGSDTAFYENISLLLAEYAIHKYSQTFRRSPTARDPRRAPPRLSRTL